MDMRGIPAMRNCLRDLDQVAREIYYALSFLPESHAARANLQLALRNLGVTGPEDVGLSRSVLKRRE
jgi:hypothetical protein